MFNALSKKLDTIFTRLTGKGVLSEEDVNVAMREVRVALLEADVALPVAKDFIEKVRAKAVGEEVVRSITPGQMVIKIVHDELAAMLKSEDAELKLGPAPSVILMAGLQGSGKTTTTGKLAYLLSRKQKQKILMASLDVARPAAQEQLAQLGRQAQIDTLPIIAGQQPLDITKRALNEARTGGYDAVILDTAGRLHTDAALMDEVQKVHALSKPAETLLVVDSLTGQDAVNIAREFKNALPLTGVILTRVDGDARGGAALSMRAITGVPIKFLGLGEKIDALEIFDAERVAGHILGMGDIVSLVEKATENIDQEEAKQLEKKLKKGQFDFDDLAKQIRTMKKMGGIGSLIGMIPGLSKFQDQLEGKVDDKMVDRQLAIILSMTPEERRKPDLLNASRKRRIAAGCGMQVEDVNKLVKQHKQMQKMMKKFGGMNKKQLMRSGLGNLLGGGN